MTLQPVRRSIFLPSLYARYKHCSALPGWGVTGTAMCLMAEHLVPLDDRLKLIVSYFRTAHLGCSVQVYILRRHRWINRGVIEPQTRTNPIAPLT